MPHGITHCYLPPGRGDTAALTPAEAGTRLSEGNTIASVLSVCPFISTLTFEPPDL